MEPVHLVKKAKRGDRNAFLELMMLHREYLYRTAFLYTRNREMACDSVQECIIRTMETVGTLKKPKYFKSWMTRILISCAITQLRQNKRFVQEPF